jgi:DnaJ domain
MDLATAGAILGVPKDATIDDAKHAYRARAQLLHPDRAEERLKTHAQQAMAQLNAAYAAFQQPGRYDPSRRPQPPPPGPPPPPPRAREERTKPPPPPPDGRLPGINECDLCGSSPALRISLSSVTGLLIRWKAETHTPKVCRQCATAVYNETQARVLIRGWWSWAGFIVSLVALAQNHFALRRHRNQVSPIISRDPLVISPHPLPLHTPSIWNRRTPWVATLTYGVLAITVIALLTTGVESVRAAIAPNVEPPTFPLGECLDVNGSVVPCDSPMAAYELTKGVFDAGQCGSFADAWRFAGDETWYCAQRLQ